MPRTARDTNATSSVTTHGVFPFNAIEYATTAQPGTAADVSHLVAPPYDVLDAQGKAALLAMDPRNIVGVDLPHLPAKELGPPESYRAAAVTLEEWNSKSVVARRAVASMYVYRQRFTFAGRQVDRTGMACVLPVRPLGPGKAGKPGILPHERTFSGPKEDRLALMRATRTQLSPIFGLHPDERGIAARLLADVCNTRQPDTTAKTADGTQHQVWRIEDRATIASYQAALNDQDVFIADGHHRYNTAVNYLAELERDGKVKADHPARRCMFVLVSMSDPGLVIGPTHRVLGGIDGYTFHAFAQHARGTLLLTQLPSTGEDALRTIEAAMAKGARRSGKNVLGLYDFPTRTAYLATPVDPDPLASIKPWTSKPLAWRTLDVALCQHLIVERLCQPMAGRKEPLRWAFPHSIPEVIDIGAGIERGSGGGKGFVPQLAVIVRPTPLEAVREVSRANELMPQKSTFFYPKLATGLFLNPLA